MAEAAEANARLAWNEERGWERVERVERWRQRGPIDLKDIWGNDKSVFSSCGWGAGWERIFV